MTEQEQSNDNLKPEEFYRSYTRPLILQFQPERFRLVRDSEKLKQWEESLRRRVGLPVQGGFADGIIGRLETCCESDCPSLPQSGDNMDTDDCDID